MIVPSSNGTMSARMRIVEEHVTRENEHNLDGIMDTFGEKRATTTRDGGPSRVAKRFAIYGNAASHAH